MTPRQLIALFDALEAGVEEIGAAIHHMRALVIASMNQAAEVPQEAAKQEERKP